MVECRLRLKGKRIFIYLNITYKAKVYHYNTDEISWYECNESNTTIEIPYGQKPKWRIY